MIRAGRHSLRATLVPRCFTHRSGSTLSGVRTGYQPVAFTTCAPAAELRNAVVFCEIQSWLTGSRLVSLPFSDHCDPLVDDRDQFASIRWYLQEQCCECPVAIHRAAALGGRLVRPFG